MDHNSDLLPLPVAIRPVIAGAMMRLATAENLRRCREAPHWVILPLHGEAILLREDGPIKPPRAFWVWHLDRALERRLVCPLVITSAEAPGSICGLGAWGPFHDQVFVSWYGLHGNDRRPDTFVRLLTTPLHASDETVVQQQRQLGTEHGVVPNIRSLPEFLR